MPGYKFSRGHQKFGGRQKGGPRHKLDPKLKERLQEFLDQGVRISPLDCMVGVMKLRIEAGDYEGALTAAEKAAPYCHSKLAMTEVRMSTAPQRSDSDIATEISALRAKLDAARALPAPPITIDVPAEPASSAVYTESEPLPEPATIDSTC
jgi:hypothetical protein